MSKRKLDEEEPPRGTVVRREPPPLPSILEDGWRDYSLFFSTVPLDCIRHLSLFLPRRQAGAVKDPRTLNYSSSVFIGASACGVCFDAENNLVVTQHSQSEVYVYDTCSGKQLRAIGTGKHGQPRACVVDRSGQTYVSEGALGLVRLFRANGTLKRELKAPYTNGLALSLDEDRLFVAASTIKAFSTSDGSFTREMKSGIISYVRAVAVLSTGQLVITGDGTGRIIILNDDLSCARTFCDAGVRADLTAITVDAVDNIYVANRVTHQIDILSKDGALIHRLGKFGIGLGDFHEPMGVAISSTGVVAVADASGVQLFRCVDFSGLSALFSSFSSSPSSSSSK